MSNNKENAICELNVMLHRINVDRRAASWTNQNVFPELRKPSGVSMEQVLNESVQFRIVFVLCSLV